jgi:hypothetical protein
MYCIFYVYITKGNVKLLILTVGYRSTCYLVCGHGNKNESKSTETVLVGLCVCINIGINHMKKHVSESKKEIVLYII